MQFERLICFDLPPRGDQLHGIVRADEARQAHGAPESGNQTELDLGLPHTCRGGNYPVGRRHGGFHPPTQRIAVYGRHRRKGEVLQAVEDLLGMADPLCQFVRLHAERGEELVDIRAHGKYPLTAGEQQPFHSVGFFQLGERLIQLAEGELVEFVDRLALQVQPQLGDALGRLQHAASKTLTLKNHGPSKFSNVLASGIEPGYILRFRGDNQLWTII